MDEKEIIKFVNKINLQGDVSKEIDRLDFKDYMSVIFYLSTHEGFGEAERKLFPKRNNKLCIENKKYHIINGGVSIPFSILDLECKLREIKIKHQREILSNTMCQNCFRCSFRPTGAIKRI